MWWMNTGEVKDIYKLESQTNSEPGCRDEGRSLQAAAVACAYRSWHVLRLWGTPGVLRTVANATVVMPSPTAQGHTRCYATSSTSNL